MQKYLIVLFFLFVTFISTEAKPRWFEYDSGSGEDYVSHGDTSAAKSDTGYNRENQYSSENGANSKDLGGYGNNGNPPYGGFGYNGYDNGRFLIRCNEQGCKRLLNAPVVSNECPNCKINNFGNGRYNTNIFYLSKGIYK